MLPEMRVATAVDVHAFSDDSERTLYLGCLPWPGEQALAGHSDADVIAHAAADALLIASGVGELGTVFGVDQPHWSGASGATLLGEAVRLVREAGWEINNISVQFIGQQPRFAPRKNDVEQAMHAVVGAPVSVAATTTDHLGFIGQGEGAGALATALVYRAS